MFTSLDRARQLIRLAALSEHEEEARTSAVAACRLIVKAKLRLSTEDAPSDDQTLSELEESARIAIERLAKKRKELGIPPGTPTGAGAGGNPFDTSNHSPPMREPWMDDLLFSASLPSAEKCRTLGCRGNKPCSSCVLFFQEVLRRCFNQELRGQLAPYGHVLYRMIEDYFARSFRNVRPGPRKRTPKGRRLTPKLRVLDGGKK